MPTQIEQLLERQTQLLEALVKAQGGAPEQANALYGRKHSTDMIRIPTPDLSTEAGVTEHRPLYDIAGLYGGFFQDGSLRQGLMNLLVYPTDGLANHIPVRPNNVIEDRHGYFARYTLEPDSDYDEGEDCGPAIPLKATHDFLKFRIGYGKLAHSLATLNVTNLILQAQARQYDQFYIMGDWRGISRQMDISLFRGATGDLDSNLIVTSAIRRKLADLGTYFQRWVMQKVWSGDPANTPNGTQIKEFYGIMRLINGKYSTSGLPIETTATPNSALETRLKDSLSSIVVNLDGKQVGDGTFSLFQTLQNVELLLWMRANNTGMNPVNWRIYMISPMWHEITRHLPAEMVADGFTIPSNEFVKNVHMNDGGTALLNMTTREQMRQSQSLTLNGRTYPVIIDDTMPYELVTDDQGNVTGYKGGIFIIPFTVMGGESVLYWEYVDYSQIYEALQPLSDRALDAKGWTDNGYYYHMITTLRSCVELQTEMQMRLIFKAPHLAARLDNLTVAAHTQWPLFHDGSGPLTPAGWLVPPASE